IGTQIERLVFQCSPHLRDIPLHAVRDYLETAANLQRTDRAEDRVAKLQVALLKIFGPVSDERLALLAELLSILSEERRAILSGFTPEEIRARTMRTLLDLVEDLAAQRLVIVIEDVHWIDPSTLELLIRLISLIRRLPVFLIVTARPEIELDF